jgi:hypothetical protein
VSAHPYGLFSAATVTNHSGGSDHWINGVAVETEACAFEAKVIDICGANPDIPVFEQGDAPRYFDGYPFGIVASDSCVSIGWSVQDRKAKVVRQLELITQKAVELELWNGAYAQTVVPDPNFGDPAMYLSSTAATQITATPVEPLVGIALLEQALATCGVGMQGTIHATPLIASMLANKGIEQDDGQLKTGNGNLVVAGAGYDGRAPGATAPPSEFVHWIYATGPVFVHLGSKELITVTEGQATNTATNEMTYVAERPAMVYWDGCCHFAVPVDVRL